MTRFYVDFERPQLRDLGSTRPRLRRGAGRQPERAGQRQLDVRLSHSEAPPPRYPLLEHTVGWITSKSPASKRILRKRKRKSPETL